MLKSIPASVLTDTPTDLPLGNESSLSPAQQALLQFVESEPAQSIIEALDYTFRMAAFMPDALTATEINKLAIHYELMALLRAAV